MTSDFFQRAGRPQLNVVLPILLALTFTYRWGLRAPGWAVLLPMWVASGFLVPIAIAVPMTTLVTLMGLDSGSRPPTAPASFKPWVFGLVFTSFVGQGLALLTAFILYVRERWGGLMRVRNTNIRQPPPAVVILGNAAFLIAAAVGLVHLLWAAGATLGLPSELLDSRGANFYLFHATFGLTALGAAAGIGMLVNRVGPYPLWVSLSLAWTGAGTMFSWGAWLVLGAVLRLSSSEGVWLWAATNVVKTCAGLLIGVLTGIMVAATARR